MTMTSPSDRLAMIREQMRTARDLKLEIEDLEATLKRQKASLNIIERETLVDLFHQSGINQLGLEPEGNLPAYNAKLAPYFKANIAADWEPERKERAFEWLNANQAGDLIKYTIIIRLPMDSVTLRDRVVNMLRSIKGLEWTQDVAVPWNSLTAFVRESIMKRDIIPPLDILGADVGHVVKLEAQKEKK